MLPNKLTIILATSLAICLTIIGALGYYTWSLKSEVKNLKADDIQLPFSAFNVTNESKHKVWDPWNNDWDPIAGFTNLHKDMDQLFSPFSNRGSILGQFINSSVDVSLEEEADNFHVIVSIPEGQEITLNTGLVGNQLFLEGVILSENIDSANNRQSRFKQSKRFSRTIILNGEIDELGMKVANDESKYTITIPKV